MTADTLKTTRVLELYQDFLSGKLMLLKVSCLTLVLKLQLIFPKCAQWERLEPLPLPYSLRYNL